MVINTYCGQALRVLIFANIRITLALPLYIPCDRSWDLQLVLVSQR